jgi:hypothetical protein
MKFYVHKNPDLATLATCRELPDDAPSPGGSFELMTLAAYDAWVEEQIAGGWAPPPIPPPQPIVPSEVGRGQLFAAFIAEGWFASDDIARASLEGIIDQLDISMRETVRALFRNATVFRTDNAFLNIVAGLLDKTQAERDALFVRAASF